MVTCGSWIGRAMHRISIHHTGCGAVWLACLTGGQKVGVKTDYTSSKNESLAALQMQKPKLIFEYTVWNKARYSGRSAAW